MATLRNTPKHYFLIVLKIVIIGITFWYIYSRLTDSTSQTFLVILDSIRQKDKIYIFLFLGLAVLNWILEIAKWKVILAPVKKIQFAEAAKQSLSAFTVSMLTPNRVGEYGAKAYYFRAEQRRQVLLLNFLGNMGQMIMTVVFGLIGLISIVITYDLPISEYKIGFLFVALIGLILAGYFFQEKELLIKGLSINNIVRYTKRLSPSLKNNILLLSLLRYACFSFLFMQLILFFGADVAFLQGYSLVITMYLFASIIPTVLVFDVVVRGGVSVWLFSIVHVPELIVLSAVLVMWILNFVIPAILGSFFVASFKSVSK